MATRAKRTIDPRKVTTVDDWLKGYKSKYGNLVRRGGEYLVLDPIKYKEDYEAALAAPVLVLQSTKAVDAQLILATADGFPQLRAQAESTMNTLNEERSKRVAEAVEAVNKAENDLLKATLTWKASVADGESVRSALANDVAATTVALRQAEANLAATKYPVRYIKGETELLQKDLDYATHSDRRVGNTVYRLVEQPTELSKRLVPFTEAGKV